VTTEDSDSIRKVKNFYISCVDVKTIESRMEQPLLHLLDNDFGGWSLIGRASDKLASMDWVRTHGACCTLYSVGPHCVGREREREELDLRSESKGDNTALAPLLGNAA